MDDIAKFAAGLSGAQMRYINAVSDAVGDYLPRHGTTANWALRHGITSTWLHYSDGQEASWDDPNRPTGKPFYLGGQRLTPLGLAVREYIRSKNYG